MPKQSCEAAVAPAERLKRIETDVLVVGGGLAGLRAALSARQSGARVLVAGKRQVGRSGSSVNTTGGYAAVMRDLNDADDEKLHRIDTIIGGGFVNDRRLVRALAEDAPVRLRELLALGPPPQRSLPSVAQWRPYAKPGVQSQEHARHRPDRAFARGSDRRGR
jgi:succinate dehydrogenase/fumarate reductase flavoprotein subunit